MTIFVLLFLLPSSSGSLPPPRSTFLLDSGLRPLYRFSLPDVHYTTTLLLSPDASTLYVGAQNALLSLDVSQRDVIRLRKQVSWSPTQDNIKTCLNKGKTETVDCLNFVHVLQQMNSSFLYACGSFAFNPREAYIDSESLSVVHSAEAKGRCPFSPSERSAAIFLDGELFTATTTDFWGNKPQISRFLSRHGRPDVSLDSSVSLLEDPTFVGSWSDPTQKKIYFFFSEVGKEFNFVQKLQIARVAQVCQDDTGGQRILQKKWTSFAKAPLLCQSSKRLPFNVLQDIFPLQPPEGDYDDTLFYGVFTSQWSTGAESAVCVFTLHDIRAEFSGAYSPFNMQSHQWSPLVEKHSYLGQCGLANSSDSQLEEVKRSFLTGSGGVKPNKGTPLVVSTDQRYSRIAVLRTRTADGRRHAILFLLTESGFIHKVALFDSGPRIIEEIQVHAKPEVFQSLVLSPSKGVLYVGTSVGVTSVPVAHCSVHKTCSQCVLARDPLCGWNRIKGVCTGLSLGEDEGLEDLVQNLDGRNVDQDCGAQTTTEEHREVDVAFGEVVTLHCQKPSNHASISWTGPSKVLSKKFFIQSADGSLHFLATADSVGKYRCEAEEGGHSEVVSSYQVRQNFAPRTFHPLPQGDHMGGEPAEDIMTEVPEPVSHRAPGHDEEVQGDSETIPPEEKKDSVSLTSQQDHRPKSVHISPPCDKQKSYHSELVVVSLLLAACVGATFLRLFYLLCHRKNRQGHGKATGVLEGCVLSSPEDQGPDLKV